MHKIKFIALQTIVFRLCFEILQLLIPECIKDKKSYGDIVWQLANTYFVLVLPSINIEVFIGGLSIFSANPMSVKVDKTLLWLPSSSSKKT